MRVLAIVPAYNEQEALGGLLDEIRALPDPVDVVVVDDGSSDQTAAVARKANVRVLRLCGNLGIGGAVQAGLRLARREGFDFAVQIDGDGQHPPAELQRLLDRATGASNSRSSVSAPRTTSNAPGVGSPGVGSTGVAGVGSPGVGSPGSSDVESSDVGSSDVGSSDVGSNDAPDLVVGTRYADDASFRSTILRRLGSWWLRVILRIVARVRVSDPTSGFRLYGPRALALFDDVYPYDFPEPESLAVARKAGLRIVETPVKMRARQGGSSSIAGFSAFYYMLKVTLAIVLTYGRARRRVS